MIILLCHNNVELSKRCFATLLAQMERTEILIIDNASTDGTNQWVKQVINHSGVFRISESTQVSVAEAWNRGLRWAWSRFYKQVLVVNNDTELRPDTYEVLRRCLNKTGTGMMTCVSVREREQMIGLWQSFVLDMDNLRPHPDFSCFMIAEWAYEKVGPFNEAYEIAHGEDNEMHVRFHRAGVKALNCGLPFLHHGAQTINRASEVERKHICEAADRNRQLFFDTYGVRIGSDEYSTLFTEESFGCDAIGSAVAATHPLPPAPPLLQP